MTKKQLRQHRLKKQAESTNQRTKSNVRYEPTFDTNTDPSEETEGGVWWEDTTDDDV